MKPSPEHQPASRTWRDIPQQVKSRSMSREGRRRVAFTVLHRGTVAVLLAGAAAGTLVLARTWTNNPGWFAAAADLAPVGRLVLETDGRLTDSWLRGVLALPANTTLVEVDVNALQARLLAHRQVAAASVAKVFPSTLAIRLTERLGVLRVPGDGNLLVGRDGLVFPAIGYEADQLAAMPLLLPDETEGPRQAGDAVRGMAVIADLLARVRDIAPELCRNWEAVDLSRLELDGLIEVRSADIPRIIFSTEYDFSDQLAWLDAVRDRAPVPLGLVNVGLGPRVIAEPAAGPAAVRSAVPPRPQPAAPAPAGSSFPLRFNPGFSHP
jgi:cell division septal protein FtsQ